MILVDEITILENIDWDDLESIRRAIDAALANGAHAKAMALIEEGRQRFPEDGRLQNLARILAPPKVLRRNVPPKPGLGETMAWLKENAADYRGEWVAIKDGNLMGHAPTRQALSEQIEVLDEQADVLITKIPPFSLDF